MEKKSKKSIIIGITGLLLVMLTLLGLTYAYYRTRIIGNENDTSVSVTSKKLEIVYSDDNAVVTAEGVEPGFTTVKDFLGNETDMKMFTVTSNSTEDVTYSVVFENIQNSFERNEDWTYTIYHVPYIVDANGNETDTSPHRTYTGTMVAGSNQIVLPAQEATYREGYTTVHKYWIGISYEDSVEDQSVDMGKSLSFKINIAEEAITWDNPGENTLLAAIKSSDEVSEPLTIPGNSSISGEAVLASAPDNYGTSYYFRGDVKNNFVTFNNMCWRIVRVQGDGSIKLVLADDSEGCSSNTWSSTPTDDKKDSAFIAFATYGYDTEVVGNTTFYNANFANGTNSEGAQKFLKAFYEGGTVTEEYTSFELSFNGFKDVDSYLKTEQWCIGDTESAYDWDTYESLKNTSQQIKEEWMNNYPSLSGADTDETISDDRRAYQIENRFYYNHRRNLKTKELDLRCRYGYSYVEQKVGLLTSDEVGYAGHAYKSASEFSYINENAWGHHWITMSLASFGDNMASDYAVSVLNAGELQTNGQLGIYNMDVASNGAKVRPAIVLNSDVKLTGGTGILTDPYVVG